MPNNPQDKFSQGSSVTTFNNFGLNDPNYSPRITVVPTITSEEDPRIIYNNIDTSAQAFFDESISTTGEPEGLKRETLPNFRVRTRVYGQDLEIEEEKSFIDTDGYRVGLFPDGNTNKFTSRIQTKGELLNSTIDIFNRHNSVQFYRVGTLYESSDLLGGESGLAPSRFPGGTPIVGYYELLASPTRPHVDLLGTGDASKVVYEGASSINDGQTDISTPAFIDETKNDIDYESISDESIVVSFNDFVSGTTDSSIRPHTKFTNQGFEYLGSELGTDSLAFGGFIR